MSSILLYEFYIQKKEIDDFSSFSLKDVESVFEKVELLSFNEHRKIRSINTLSETTDSVAAV